jgi:hypothetical protein
VVVVVDVTAAAATVVDVTLVVTVLDDIAAVTEATEDEVAGAIVWQLTRANGTISIARRRRGRSNHMEPPSGHRLGANAAEPPDSLGDVERTTAPEARAYG